MQKNVTNKRDRAERVRGRKERTKRRDQIKHERETASNRTSARTENREREQREAFSVCLQFGAHECVADGERASSGRVERGAVVVGRGLGWMGRERWKEQRENKRENE